jgi:hypothetical protein
MGEKRNAHKTLLEKIIENRPVKTRRNTHGLIISNMTKTQICLDMTPCRLVRSYRKLEFSSMPFLEHQTSHQK